MTQASVARSILRFRDQTLERRYSDGSGESAAEAARTVVTTEGGTGKPLFGGELVSRLHTEHGLRACDARYVTREDLEQIGTSAEQCSIILELLANPAPAPSAEPSDARPDAGVSAAEADDDGAISRTQSSKAASEFDAWLAAIHLQRYASMIKDKGMDVIDDVAEVLEDASALDTFQLRLFEQARFLRAAATIAGAEGNSTRQLEHAAGIGTLKRTASGQIGLDRSGSAGDIVSWLGMHSLQHLADPLVADAGLHICDLPHVTDEQLQRAGVEPNDRSAFLLAVSQHDEDTTTPELPPQLEPEPKQQPELEPQLEAQSQPLITNASSVSTPTGDTTPEAVPPALQDEGAPSSEPQPERQSAHRMPQPVSSNADTEGDGPREMQEVTQWLVSAGLQRYVGVFIAQEMTPDSLRGLAREASGQHEQWRDTQKDLQAPPFSMTLGAVLALRERLLSSEYCPK